MKKLLLLAATAMLGLSVAKADVTFGLAQEFSGATPPSGTGPWVTLTFENAGANTVTLTITAKLTGTEYVDSVYFNVADAFADENVLDITRSGGTAPAEDSIDIGEDSYKPDGDGLMDVRIEFPNSNTGTNPRFDGTETAIFTLVSTGLTEDDFDFLSTTGSNKPGLPAAAHVQGIGPSGSLSGWITTVPEIPGLHAALLLALPMGLAAVRRFRAKKA